MSEQRFFRVVAHVEFDGEWFVPIVDDIKTPEDAANYLRDHENVLEPENEIREARAVVDLASIYITDETGEPIEDES